MRMRACLSILLILAMSMAAPELFSKSSAIARKAHAGSESKGDSAIGYLTAVMDQFDSVFDVYTDSDAAGNHFVVKARMSSEDSARERHGELESVPSMDEACAYSPHSGATCIKATFRKRAFHGQPNWGGWYFMNGVMPDPTQPDPTQPGPNWGDIPNAGVNLRDATKLTFWVRGHEEGEKVEFFALGVGRNADTGRRVNNFPDSSPKVSTGRITLTKNWEMKTIDLSGRDLSYVLGGFGWVASAADNTREEISFYLDDIRYELRSHEKNRHFILSYDTPLNSVPDMVLRNVAYSYDNALALMAFLASGDKKRAGLIADAFVYAQQHDRFYADGRMRNAYQAGDLVMPPGWTSKGKQGTVRMSGWYNRTQKEKEGWVEDRLNAGSNTGNVAWVMLALLAYYQTAGGQEYLAAVERMAEWVEAKCRDRQGDGYYAGYEGFEEKSPANTEDPKKLTYKSTEHNIDLYAVFQRLYRIDKEPKWKERAESAERFVESMWDKSERKFWTGTKPGGSTNEEVIPIDIQAWAILSLRDNRNHYRQALDYAEAHMKCGEGFDFSKKMDVATSDGGVWYEGTAQMAAALYCSSKTAEADRLIRFVESRQDPTGGIYATDKPALKTGFWLSNGDVWFYYHRLHVGATAWFVLAKKHVNPFWMGTTDENCVP